MIIRLSPSQTDFPLIPGNGMIWKLLYAWMQVTTTASEAVNASLYRKDSAEEYVSVNATIDSTGYAADGGATNQSHANAHIQFNDYPIITYHDGIGLNTNGTADTTFAFLLLMEEMPE